eukprot:m.13357 g.13357  ORF g.13357 m.13357 type:complete len:107 (+) comp24728_c0_seq1:467-787(+)
MGFRRMNIFTVVTGVASKVARTTHSKAKQEGISGNLKGDGFQNGGTFVVNKGGSEVLLSHFEIEPGSHVDPKAILKALNIPDDDLQSETSPKVTCTDDACAIPDSK